MGSRGDCTWVLGLPGFRDAAQRAAVTAVCTDMHRPYLNAVGAVMPHAEIVFDKFHVLAARPSTRSGGRSSSGPAP